MKRLNHNNVKVEELTKLSSSISPRQLFRISKDRYVIAILDEENRMFHFESPIATQVIDDLDLEIVDLSILEKKEPNNQAEFDLGDADFEIWLHLENSMVIVMNSDDQIYLMIQIYKRPDEESTVTPVMEIWDLPEEYPFPHLQITESFRRALEPYMDSISPADVIRRLWQDYQILTKGNITKLPLDCTIHVKGEFGNYTVIEHPCGNATLTK